MSWSYDFLDNLYSAYKEAVGKKPKLERQILSALHQVGVFNTDGGPGSGNWGHEGRPGEVGGSVEGGGVHNRQTTKTGSYTSFAKKRKSLATPHKFGEEDLNALKRKTTVLLINGERFCQYDLLGDDIGICSLTTGEVLEPEDLYGKEVRTIISKTDNPSYSITKESTAKDLRSKFDKAYRSETSEDADDRYRSKTGEVWKSLGSEARSSLVGYTGTGYTLANGTLRGEYGSPSAKTAGRINAITDAIGKSTFDEDTVLYRGVSTSGFEKLFGLPRDSLKPENVQSLVGRTRTERGFLSCGTAKDTGFDFKKVQMQILCPAGTQAIYAEPFSLNGGGDSGWDGESPQRHLGDELETIVQQGSRLTILSADYELGEYRIKAAILSQKPKKY